MTAEAAPTPATSSGGTTAATVTRAATLGVFALAMIEVAAVLTPRNYPSMAELGWSSVGWYVIGLLLFFLPLSLVGAELATGWPKGGGVYAWVREAWGERYGFVSIWCEWAENVVWFPTVLAFIVATISFGLFPGLGENHWLTFAIMMVIFWGVTWLNMYGEKYSSKLTNLGAMFGVMLPTVVMIVLMLVYVLQGKTMAAPFDGPSSLMPTIDLANLPYVQTVILLFAGMEMAGFHALETRNPGRDFPRAILIATVIIFTLTTLGTLAIVVTVNASDLSLAGGMMESIKLMLDAIGLPWLVAPMALILAFGSIAQLSTWLIGPAKGLGTAAAQGDMPPRWRQHNKHGSPVAVLVIQAVLATILALLFVVVPSANSAYWILQALTTLIIIVMYLLMFSAVIRLRYTQPNTKRAYRIPGGIPGVWLVGGVALVALVFSFVIGLLPPGSTDVNTAVYIAIMLIGAVAFSYVVPAIIYRFRKPEWKAPNWQAYLDGTEDD
jgi:amino acid transporter